MKPLLRLVETIVGVALWPLEMLAVPIGMLMGIRDFRRYLRIRSM